MNSRQNANVSSNPRVSVESRDDIAKLNVVNRFQNVRSHGSHKSLSWRYFRFLFYHDGEKRNIHSTFIVNPLKLFNCLCLLLTMLFFPL